MTDDIGDTAVRSGHVDIVRSLMDLLRNPEHDFPANKVGETPIYLATESGFHDALIEILNIYKEPTYVTGPLNRTPLHAAVIQEHTGLRKLVSDMLKWKKSLAYDWAGSENDWTTAFHIAASEGHKSMMHELLKHCPDCWDMVNSNGQNVLHVAILLNDHERFVQALFKLRFCNSLVDKADNEGNTPLHLLAAYGNHVPESILDNPRAKKMTFNKQNQTPLDIASSRTRTIRGGSNPLVA
ncbi:ankyrin repeat-containing protein At5g02620-like [Solanum stenotomum]|uniref:ankyrin repeat-containing protein At5g02620-like n=1 Tax=Solanum stenotomum TaxID=172797 RepID=UPI0020D16138|nr:ankyrin repeat-containing protein At5g02620-like [Solanum stenotomum]